MKRTGTSKKNGKQFTYYCCEFAGTRPEERTCDFMTWDVPTKDDCPKCGQTMFKRAGRGFNRPFCVNEKCENFLPEEKRGYPVKKAAGKKAAAKKTTAKKTTAAKKTTKKKTEE